ncbi:MAG: HD domain-containing protein [Candidatus Poribacteria bacterium]|nr:HD domain-containing protein [Candidatus Poribacteria bacterium]
MIRFEQQIDFLKEVDKLKNIIRRNYLCDGNRFENTAEHSWHLALMVMTLAEHTNNEIDILKTILMLLIHDLVEIDAGDTYCYDSTGNETKAKREEEAANRIFSLLPLDQQQVYHQFWREFEERETPESQFANAVDRLMPLIQNVETGGKTWQKNHISESQVLERNLPINDGSAVLWNYAKFLIKSSVTKGILNN